MHIALWDIPPADILATGLESRAIAVPLEVERHDARTCTDLLLQHQVDIALLPSHIVLSNTDVFDVLPGAAFSTWTYPFARLLLRHGVERVETVVYAQAHTQEALIARVILEEHYGQSPSFISVEAPTTGDLLSMESEGMLVVGPDAPMLQTEYVALDLGQEWYELANYPMVWGLFATLKETASPVMVEIIMEAVRTAEQQRPLWTQAREMPPVLHQFYTEGLRLRFDDMATASLTELRQYLYFYKLTEELPEMPLYELPDDWDDDTNEVPLL